MPATCTPGTSSRHSQVVPPTRRFGPNQGSVPASRQAISDFAGKPHSDQPMLRAMGDLRIPDAVEREEFSQILQHAFAARPSDVLGWLEAAGHEELRVYRDGRVRAGLIYVPMGQFFGGQSVPMMGIAGVGVRADDLRQGHATAMMTQALRESAERGFALSTLYASTMSLYRRVGYEAAGSRFLARLSPNEIAMSRAELLPVQRMEPEHREEIQALYDAHAAKLAGHLDRGPYIWPRLLEARFGAPAHGLLVRDDRGALVGWIAYRKHAAPGGYSRIEVTDWLATTPQTHRRLWTVVRDQGTMCREVELPTAPHDPAYLALPDPHFELRLLENWMMRIVDVPAALRARGYPPGVTATVDFEVEDEVLPANAGTWRLRIEHGQSRVEPGGTGSLRIHVRALASLFTGFADPWTLAQTGRLEGNAADLQAAAAVFAGPLPWMREMF